MQEFHTTPLHYFFPKGLFFLLPVASIGAYSFADTLRVELRKRKYKAAESFIPKYDEYKHPIVWCTAITLRVAL